MIVKAALHVFGSLSYADATTAEVARLAGVSQATIFKHFNTKRDLFVAVLERTTELVLERWRAAAEEAATPLDGLYAIARTYAMMAYQQELTFRVRIRAVAESADPVIAAAARGSYLTLIDFLTENIARARAAGQLCEDLDPKSAAWYFLSVGQGFNLNHFVGFGWDEAVLADLTAFLFQGFGAAPAVPSNH